MIRFIRADDLHLHSQLRDSMFRDRADQFKTRLGWAVSVDGTGYEMDAYDQLNPLYVICQGADGGHLGSMRFLPMTGPNMIEDHFSHLLSGQQIGNDRIWECTRFCLGQNAGPHVAGRLMSAGGEILHGFGLDAFAGVFDEQMIRIYKRIGAAPEIIGSEGQGRDKISLGLWRFTSAARSRVARRSGLSEQIIRHWFESCFGRQTVNPFTLPAQ